MSSGPNKEAAELRELDDEELRSKLTESKEELFNLRFQNATGQLDNNRRLRSVRRDIARVYSLLRERELGIASAPVLVADDEQPKKRGSKRASKKTDEAATTEAGTDDVHENSEVPA